MRTFQNLGFGRLSAFLKALPGRQIIRGGSKNKVRVWSGWKIQQKVREGMKGQEEDRMKEKEAVKL